MSTELIEAQRAFKEAQSEARESDASYGKLYQDLQSARSEHRPVDALELQSAVIRAAERQALARQILGGRQAKLKACEKRAVAAQCAEQVREYARLCDEVTHQLALLMVISERLGEPFDPAIGSFRLPGFGLKADDSGAYRSFNSLQPLMADAGKKLDALLTQENSDEHMATT